jgi:hypothetical protein
MSVGRMGGLDGDLWVFFVAAFEGSEVGGWPFLCLRVRRCMPVEGVFGVLHKFEL